MNLCYHVKKWCYILVKLWFWAIVMCLRCFVFHGTFADNIDFLIVLIYQNVF